MAPLKVFNCDSLVIGFFYINVLVLVVGSTRGFFSALSEVLGSHGRLLPTPNHTVPTSFSFSMAKSYQYFTHSTTLQNITSRGAKQKNNKRFKSDHKTTASDVYLGAKNLKGKFWIWFICLSSWTGGECVVLSLEERCYNVDWLPFMIGGLFVSERGVLQMPFILHTPYNSKYQSYSLPSKDLNYRAMMMRFGYM